MNLINIKERQMLQEWAVAHSDECAFDRGSEGNGDTYFITRDKMDTYIIKYEFESIPQLRGNIEKISGDRIDLQTQKLLAIAAFKCKMPLSGDMQETDVKNSVDRGKLPEFTYAF